jgi:hypothetical protein
MWEMRTLRVVDVETLSLNLSGAAVESASGPKTEWLLSSSRRTSLGQQLPRGMLGDVQLAS